MANLDKLKPRHKAAAPPPATPMQIKPATRPGAEAKQVQVNFRLPEDVRVQLRQRVLSEGTTVQAVLERLVDEYLAE